MVGKTTRMKRLFNEESGKTFTIAVDEGMRAGPVKGIERLEEVFSRLDPWADAWLMSKGVLRHCLQPDGVTGIILQATGGSTTTQAFPVGEGVVASMEEALTLGADAVAATVFIGTAYERESLLGLAGLVAASERWQVPVVAVLGAGVVQERMQEEDFWALGARVAAEHGADLVHAYWVEEGFEKVVEGCPVPVIMSGGPKQEEPHGVLEMVESALQAGVEGVVMGTTLWGAKHPEALAEAIARIVHRGASVADAVGAYQEIEKSDQA